MKHIHRVRTQTHLQYCRHHVGLNPVRVHHEPRPVVVPPDAVNLGGFQLDPGPRRQHSTQNAEEYAAHCVWALHLHNLHASFRDLRGSRLSGDRIRSIG